MVNILRIELRRSFAPWAALALVVFGLGFLFLLTGPWWKDPAPWFGNWTTTALWLRFLLVFLWPVAVGAGAIQGMRDRRSGMIELLGTTPRPPGHRATRLAGATAVLTAAGYGVVFLVGAVLTVVLGGFVSVSFVPVVVVGALGVVAGALLGLGIGRLLPHPLTAPALAAVALAVSIILMTAHIPGASPLPSRIALLSPALTEPRGVFVTTAISVDSGQFVWFAGLAVTGVALLGARSVRTRLLGLLPAALTAVLAVSVFPATAAGETTTDAVAAQRHCDGTVCVTRLHEDRLPVMTTAGRQALRLLARVPGAPTRVDEDTAPAMTGTPRRDRAVVLVDLQSFPELRAADADGLRLAMVAGAGTPSCYQAYDYSAADIAARTISAAWFTGELRPLPQYGIEWRSMHDMVTSAWQRFRQLPQRTQLARIAAMRQVLLTCQGNPLTALVPEATS